MNKVQKLKCDNVQKGRVADVSMTWGSQQELARQKNKKRQSSSVKGKHRAAGAIVPQAEGHADHTAEAEKGKREGGSQVAVGLCVQPSCLGLCAWSQCPHAGVSCHRAPGPQDPWRSLGPESAAGPFCASFPSGSLSSFRPLLEGEGVILS